MAAISAPRIYRGVDVAVLVPTMNRPGKLTRLFESLARQTATVGRVIVVDGGESAAEVAKAFAGRLTVDYFQCHPPGQLRQRNHGIAQLREENRLVAVLDDDIVLEPEAVAEMVKFWSDAEPQTAGVCFNIVNGDPPRRSALGALLGLDASQPGRVLRSGMTTAVTHVDRSMRVQWLPGGATVWRRDVLLARAHAEISARWAIGEDLIFSFPIGLREPLYVCASAKVHHEHVSDYGVRRQERYHGRTQTLWMYHFVASNRELSRAGYIWAVAIRMLGKMVLRGVLRLDSGSREFVYGQASALWSILRNAIDRGDTRSLLNDPPPQAATRPAGASP